MKYIIYRKKISFKSGTGQLISMQIEKLKEINKKFSIYCKKGWLQIFLKNKVIANKAKVKNNHLILNKKNNDPIFIIDHDTSLVNADITFIHNIPLEKENISYFTWLKKSNCKIITNSLFTKDKLLEQGYKRENICIVYPGYNHNKFNIEVKKKNRSKARKKLNINDNELVVGFITSGDLKKRGLDYFIAICEKLNNISNIKFFIMGAKKFPSDYLNHDIVSSNKFIYKEKNSTPEYWLSAVDIFIYPARFEEFGMVIPEALSMGIPVITTRNVGASEILPSSYNDFINDIIDVDWFVEQVKKLYYDKELYQKLCQDAQQGLDYNNEDYASRSMNIIFSQKPTQ
ncbi:MULTISPECIES: glycosyltransferase family 4 protein [Vibrio]|uniref:glycosyltransferase family 4 protein n=1 Tax=Vibrio TaxID=662 RepID=UPI000C1689AC|nr:glycosyltransferase family 4 protein [Vibrio fujianensis]